MGDIHTLRQMLLGLLPGGAVIRIIQCLIMIAVDPEQEQHYRRRIRNALIFTVLAICATVIVDLLNKYAQGG